MITALRKVRSVLTSPLGEIKYCSLLTIHLSKTIIFLYFLFNIYHNPGIVIRKGIQYS